MPIQPLFTIGNPSPRVSTDQSGVFSQTGNIQFQVQNGFTVHNPQSPLVLWVSKSGYASPNTSGSYCVPPFGTLATQYGERFSGTLGLYGVAGQPFTLSTY